VHHVVCALLEQFVVTGPHLPLPWVVVAAAAGAVRTVIRGSW
jgi:hypothetical protein